MLTTVVWPQQQQPSVLVCLPIHICVQDLGPGRGKRPNARSCVSFVLLQWCVDGVAMYWQLLPNYVDVDLRLLVVAAFVLVYVRLSTWQVPAPDTSGGCVNFCSSPG